MAKYQRIVFMQGEDADEALRILDEQGEDAVITFLADWDYGEGEIEDEPASGDCDDGYESEGYRLSYNTRLVHSDLGAR